MPKWTIDNIPDQTGRIVIVTGANSGLGLYTTQVMARKGAQVIMACRNPQKAEEAYQQVMTFAPGAKVEVMALDLGDLASVRSFAEAFKARYDHIDLLYNNAGLMGVPYGLTKDGFEMQFGVNHLGHFALTGLLLDRIKTHPHSRVITLTSSAALYGQIKFDDLDSKKGYSRYGAYGQAKLANLIFARELHRRLADAKSPTISLAAQPGFILTDLQARASRESGSGFEDFLYQRVARVLSQPIEMGGLSQLYAGTAPNVKGGEFYSPERFHVFGYPAVYPGPRASHDLDIARRLWEVSEQLTGVAYNFTV